MIARPSTSRSLALAAGALLLTGALVGCGNDTESPAEAMSGMDGMSAAEMASMNDPDATPADELGAEGAEVESGTFTVLDTAPPGSDAVTGEAWLAQDDDGTTVTIRLTGLEPGAVYASHLHAETCEVDNGGPHFAFDPDGPEVPPNEVHLGFTADAQGDGEATITSDRQVGDAAPAIVVHPAESMDNRLACADFTADQPAS